MVPHIPSALKSNGSQEVSAKAIISDGYIYMNGLRLTADEDTKYQAVTYKDQEYLINENNYDPEK